jgi:hypothetical protein
MREIRELGFEVAVENEVTLARQASSRVCNRYDCRHTWYEQTIVTGRVGSENAAVKWISFLAAGVECVFRE